MEYTTDDGRAWEMTPGQRWAADAHALLEARDNDAFFEMLSDDFVFQPRRVQGHEDGRHQIVETVEAMNDLSIHIGGGSVAVAGDYCVLTRRRYELAGHVRELLAVSCWSPDGKLERLIEFDARDLDSALAALGEVSQQKVVLVRAAEGS